VPGPVPEWRQAARNDLLAIVDYISDDNPAAAQALKDEIETKVARLPVSTDPDGSRVRGKWWCTATIW
jgi:plasmid stabilization system protein ParE